MSDKNNALENLQTKDERNSDPCERCGAPVYGYSPRYCCDGQECGCMGRPIEPCWCEACWMNYMQDAKRRAVRFSQRFKS